jgi:glyoxylase-like metal-dependent hydrolase (beta-lactamase superfamily II)
MVSIKSFVFNPFQENTYLLFDHTKKCVIVDPGCYDDDEFNQLAGFIEDNDLKPERLINTHGHVDHVLGNNYVLRRFAIGAELNALDAGMIKQAVDFGNLFGIKVEEPAPIENF